MKPFITLYILCFACSISLFSQTIPDTDTYNTVESSAKRIEYDDYRESNKEIKIYPNPVYYDFTMEFLTPDAYSVSILDNYGQKVFEQKEARDKIVINCQDVQRGFFFVQVMNLETNTYFFIRMLRR